MVSAIVYLFFYIFFHILTAVYDQIYGFCTDGITCKVVLLVKNALTCDNIQQEQRTVL